MAKSDKGYGWVRVLILKRRRRKSVFCEFFFAVLSSEISFSFSPTIVTRTRALNFGFKSKVPN